jgi:hypothetical protein
MKRNEHQSRGLSIPIKVRNIGYGCVRSNSSRIFPWLEKTVAPR